MSKASNEREPPVLIVGAGVAGMAVSKRLSDFRISHEIVDRHGVAGGSYLRMYRHMQLSSPPRYLALPGALPPQSKKYLKVDEYIPYLIQYAAENRISPIKAEVIKVERCSSGFQVTFGDGIDTRIYSSVVVCTGSFEHPHVPVIRGLNDTSVFAETRISFSHACQWKGPKFSNTDRLLIVGGGMTAIELAEECVQNGISPILSFQSGRGRTFPARLFGIDLRFITYPLMRLAPLRLFRRQCFYGWRYRGINRGFEAYRKQRLLDIRPLVHSVQDRTVTFTDGSTVEADHIVFATGYRWDVPFLPTSIPKGHQGNPILKHGESVAYPGLFCVGITCSFSAGSHFIHGVNRDSKAVAEAILKRTSSVSAKYSRRS